MNAAYSPGADPLATVDGHRRAVTLADIAPRELRGWFIAALVIGVLGTAGLIVGGLVDPPQFFRAYLAAWLFCLNVGMGSMIVLMIYHLTGGAWGFLVRRLLEAGTRTLLLSAIGFIPIALGIRYLYPFAQPAAVAGSDLLQKQQGYMNPPFFWARAAAYLILWLVLALLLNLWSRAEDRTGDPRYGRRLNGVSSIGGVIVGATLHFAAIDWVLAMQPGYHSTIAGPLLAAQQLISGFSLSVILFTAICRRPPLAGLVGPKTLNDVGNMLLTFVIIWSYLLFFEFMLIWIADMQVDVAWYGERLRGVWAVVGVVLAAGQFVVPFVLLLQRGVKRNPALLGGVAVLSLLMQMLFVHFQILPSFRPAAFGQWWMSLVAPVGLGGLLLACYLLCLGRLPLLAQHDLNALEAIRLRRSDDHEEELEASLVHG